MKVSIVMNVLLNGDDRWIPWKHRPSKRSITSIITQKLSVNTTHSYPPRATTLPFEPPSRIRTSKSREPHKAKWTASAAASQTSTSPVSATPTSSNCSNSPSTKGKKRASNHVRPLVPSFHITHLHHNAAPPYTLLPSHSATQRTLLIDVSSNPQPHRYLLPQVHPRGRNQERQAGQV